MRASSARLFPRAILFSTSMFEVAMRLAFAAGSLYLCLFALCAEADSAQAPPPAAPTAAPAATTATATSANDAAAKHAKRTACLQEAKTKKLIGADKTAFLKTCNTA
jgi:hypothetical protein